MKISDMVKLATENTEIKAPLMIKVKKLQVEIDGYSQAEIDQSFKAADRLAVIIKSGAKIDRIVEAAKGTELSNKVNQLRDFQITLSKNLVRIDKKYAAILDHDEMISPAGFDMDSGVYIRPSFLMVADNLKSFPTDMIGLKAIKL